MLYPQTNALRQHVDLSGFWEFRADPDREAAAEGWQTGFTGGQPIAVPASWNEQIGAVYNYWSDGWYQTTFDRPWGWDDKRVLLRFGSVNYVAEVWLNGVRLGEHAGGHLPFEFEVTEHVKPIKNRLVVRVNGDLHPNHVPAGNVPFDPLDQFSPESRYPHTSFDFFPYTGIHRPVVLYATTPNAIRDLTVITDVSAKAGIVHVLVDAPVDDAKFRVGLTGHDAYVQVETTLNGTGTTEVALLVPSAALWSPASPTLYDLTAEIVRNGTVLDRYLLPVGIRTVAVEGDQLLLNGEPIVLRGYGRHEDFAISGRGYNPAVIIKDYDLMRWTGANSFRTTHYPYSEQMLDLADRLGFLVIDETPAVEMYFNDAGRDERLATWKQMTEAMVRRDKNHPSVIMWSVANEPHSRRPEAKPAFKEVIDLVRKLDATRPVTFASYLGVNDQGAEWGDVICLNRYSGWYSESGQINEGVKALDAELDALYEKFKRPILVTEFGADTVAGVHHEPPVMFSEEYQSEMLAGYIEVMDRKPFVVGQHVWNLCDFRTYQSVRRIGALNMKGVFTRDRRPKLAAHTLRKLWRR